MKDKAENIITTELAKQNVTEAVIAKLKADYLPLKINGIDDKVGYKKVHDARIVCRDHRTLAEKICKAGREDAVKEQKAWIAKEKEVVAKISEVEQYLKKQEDAIDKIIEDQKIRAERLLKLPGRKEESVGMQDYFTMELLDENIMSFNDAEWKDLLLMARSRKLDAQQKIIDAENAKKLLEKTILRENELIAAGAILYSDGLGKVYRKGSASVTAQTIKDCIDEGWPKIVEVFQNAVIPPKPEPNFSPKLGASIPRPAVVGNVFENISDDEKLFNYASALEKTWCPSMNTEVGKKVLAEASELIVKAINILRK